MSHRRDMQELMRRVRKAGYETRLSGGGHWLVFRENRLLVTASQTPSDYRVLENVMHELRRAGVELNGAKYQPKEHVAYPDLPAEQASLLGRLNAAIVELGFDPNAKRSGATSEITRRAIKAEGENAPTFESFTQSVNRLRKGLPISNRSQRILDGVVNDVIGEAALAAAPFTRASLSDSKDLATAGEETPAPLAWRVLAAILDPSVGRDEALALAREVELLG